MKKILFTWLFLVSIVSIAFCQFGGGPFGGGSGSVSDTAYGETWNGQTSVAPSKNAVYDKIETILAGDVNWLDAEIMSDGINWVDVEQLQPMSDKELELAGLIVSGSGSNTFGDSVNYVAIDASGGMSFNGAAILEIPNGTTLPASCSVGQLFFDSDATTGQRLYGCESTDTWSVQGDGGVGSGDNVTVKGTEIDTTANFVDSDIGWMLTDGGAGGPDNISGEIVTNAVDATKIDWGTGEDQVSALAIPTVITNFDGTLSSADTTVQSALETIDEILVGKDNLNWTDLENLTRWEIDKTMYSPDEFTNPDRIIVGRNTSGQTRTITKITADSNADNVDFSFFVAGDAGSGGINWNDIHEIEAVTIDQDFVGDSINWYSMIELTTGINWTDIEPNESVGINWTGLDDVEYLHFNMSGTETVN